MHNANDTAGCAAHAARLSQEHEGNQLDSNFPKCRTRWARAKGSGPTPTRYREYLPEYTETKERLEKVGSRHGLGNEGSAAS